jgi:hypothetical protein
MKNFSLLILLFPMLSISQTIHMYDVFPLNINRMYSYSYEHHYEYYELGYLINLSTDSGAVKYIVLDSISLCDTIIRWTIKQHEDLYHLRGGLSRGGSDTTYWSNHDTTFFLYENSTGKHEITCSSLIWSFPLLDLLQQRSVYRFADSSTSLIGRPSTLMDPDFNYDTLRFNASIGFYSRNSASQYIHISRSYSSLNVKLLSTSTNVNSPIAHSNSATEFQLFQNYPNPFNPSTIISYYLLSHSYVRLSIYNSLGQRIQDLINEYEQAGFHQIKYYGSTLSSGVYYYRLWTGDQALTRSFILLK